MKFLFTLLLGFTMTLSMQAQDCDCDLTFDGEWVCAQDDTGEVYPVPNTCFATCLGLEVVDSELCDFDVYGGDSTEIVISYDDCDCEIDDELDFICVLTDAETGITCPFPNLCFAECAGYTADDVIEGDCDFTNGPFGNGGLGNGGFPWGEWNGGFEDPCDCEDDLEGEGICILITYTDTFDGETYTESFEAWAPNECFADCYGYDNYIVTDCDSIWTGNDGWGGNDDWEDPCDCEDDGEGEGICIVITYSDTFDGETYTETFEAWVPNECFADCYGYENYIVTDCDSIWTGNDGWSGTGGTFGNDCDCEIDDTQEFICVLTDSITGAICPFPNLCFAECAGYTAADVVVCGEGFDFEIFETLDLFECEDCVPGEGEAVCVDIQGLVIEFPSACYAECLGLEIVDCDGDIIPGLTSVPIEAYTIGYIPVEDYPTQRVVNTTSIVDVSIFPNPATETINITLNVDIASNSTMTIIDATGKMISNSTTELVKGNNSLDLDVNALTTGVYYLQLKDAKQSNTYRFIKL